MNDGRSIVAFAQQSSFGGRRKLRQQLLHALRASESSVILDLTEQRTLDAQDIETLLDCVAQAAGQDTPLFLAAGSHAVRVILEVTQIASVVPVFDSLQDAISSVSDAAHAVPMTIQETQFQQPWSA